MAKAEVAISLADEQAVINRQRNSSQFNERKRGRPTKKRSSKHNIFPPRSPLSPSTYPQSPPRDYAMFNKDSFLELPKMQSQALSRSYSYQGILDCISYLTIYHFQTIANLKMKMLSAPTMHTVY